MPRRARAALGAGGLALALASGLPLPADAAGTSSQDLWRAVGARWDAATRTISLSRSVTTDRTLTIPDGWTLDGNGYTLRALAADGFDGSSPVLTDAPAGGRPALAVVNLTVDATGLCTAGPCEGLVLTGVGAEIHDVHVTGLRTQDSQSVGTGIRLDSTGSRTAVDFEVRDVTVDDCGAVGLEVGGSRVTADVAGSTFTAGGRTAAAVRILEGATATLTGNTLVGGAGIADPGPASFTPALALREAGEVHVSRNTFLGAQVAVAVKAGRPASVVNNRFTGRRAGAHPWAAVVLGGLGAAESSDGAATGGTLPNSTRATGTSGPVDTAASPPSTAVTAPASGGSAAPTDSASTGPDSTNSGSAASGSTDSASTASVPRTGSSAAATTVATRSNVVEGYTDTCPAGDCATVRLEDGGPVAVDLNDPALAPGVEKVATEWKKDSQTVVVTWTASTSGSRAAARKYLVRVLDTAGQAETDLDQYLDASAQSASFGRLSSGTHTVLVFPLDRDRLEDKGSGLSAQGEQELAAYTAEVLSGHLAGAGRMVTVPWRPTAKVVPESVTQGGSVTVSGSGFAPGEEVTIDFVRGGDVEWSRREKLAENSDRLRYTTVVPAQYPGGSYSVRVTGLTSGARVELPLQVQTLAPTPHDLPTLDVDPGTVRVGGTLTVTGAHFEPGETVGLQLSTRAGEVATARVGADATFTAELTLPADTPAGGATVIATGDTSLAPVEAALNVEALLTAETGQAKQGGGLPMAGADIGLTALWALGLASVGACAVWLRHRGKVFG